VKKMRLPASNREKTQYAKAAAAGVNAGAIARAEALENKRPDLASKVRAGNPMPVCGRAKPRFSWT
jgi:hypothetical protein